MTNSGMQELADHLVVARVAIHSKGLAARTFILILATEVSAISLGNSLVADSSNADHVVAVMSR